MKSFVILPKEAKPGKKIFIVSCASWNDLLRYILIVEQQGYVATNSGWKNNYKAEIDAADTYTTLRGWSETQRGQDMFYYAKSKGLSMIPRVDLFKSKPETQPQLHGSSPDEPSQPLPDEPSQTPSLSPEASDQPTDQIDQVNPPTRIASKRKPQIVIPITTTKTKRNPNIFENDR